MADTFLFERRSLGGRTTASGELLITRCGVRGDDAPDTSVSFRLTEELMTRLRWLPGDLVVAGIEKNGSPTGVCKIRRVSTAASGGCKLSASGKRHATVRFTLDAQDIDRLFPGQFKNYTGSLLRVEDDGTAVFGVSFV